MNKTFLLFVIFIFELTFADSLVIRDSASVFDTMRSDFDTSTSKLSLNTIETSSDDSSPTSVDTDLNSAVLVDSVDDYDSLLNQFQDSLVKLKSDTLKSFSAFSGVFSTKPKKLVFVFLIIFLTILIFVIFRFFKRAIDSKSFLTSTRLSLMDTEVQIACRYMEKNYSKSELTLESICSDLTTGPAFLEALFQKEIGMGVEQFLEQVRINRAKILVSERKIINPTEIANLVGYSSTDDFRNDFKVVVGISFEEFVESKFSGSE